MSAGRQPTYDEFIKGLPGASTGPLLKALTREMLKAIADKGNTDKFTIEKITPSDSGISILLGADIGDLIIGDASGNIPPTGGEASSAFEKIIRNKSRVDDLFQKYPGLIPAWTKGVANGQDPEEYAYTLLLLASLAEADRKLKIARIGDSAEKGRYEEAEKGLRDAGYLTAITKELEDILAKHRDSPAGGPAAAAAAPGTGILPGAGPGGEAGGEAAAGILPGAGPGGEAGTGAVGAAAGSSGSAAAGAPAGATTPNNGVNAFLTNVFAQAEAAAAAGTAGILPAGGPSESTAAIPEIESTHSLAKLAMSAFNNLPGIPVPIGEEEKPAAEEEEKPAAEEKSPVPLIDSTDDLAKLAMAAFNNLPGIPQPPAALDAMPAAPEFKDCERKPLTKGGQIEDACGNKYDIIKAPDDGWCLYWSAIASYNSAITNEYEIYRRIPDVLNTIGNQINRQIRNKPEDKDQILPGLTLETALAAANLETQPTGATGERKRVTIDDLSSYLKTPREHPDIIIPGDAQVKCKDIDAYYVFGTEAIPIKEGPLLWPDATVIGPFLGRSIKINDNYKKEPIFIFKKGASGKLELETAIPVFTALGPGEYKFIRPNMLNSQSGIWLLHESRNPDGTGQDHFNALRPTFEGEIPTEYKKILEDIARPVKNNTNKYVNTLFKKINTDLEKEKLISIITDIYKGKTNTKNSALFDNLIDDIKKNTLEPAKYRLIIPILIGGLNKMQNSKEKTALQGFIKSINIDGLQNRQRAAAPPPPPFARVGPHVAPPPAPAGAAALSAPPAPLSAQERQAVISQLGTLRRKHSTYPYDNQSTASHKKNAALYSNLIDEIRETGTISNELKYKNIVNEMIREQPKMSKPFKNITRKIQRARNIRTERNAKLTQVINRKKDLIHARKNGEKRSAIVNKIMGNNKRD